jgi:hypothetical protein
MLQQTQGTRPNCSTWHTQHCIGTRTQNMSLAKAQQAAPLKECASVNVKTTQLTNRTTKQSHTVGIRLPQQRFLCHLMFTHPIRCCVRVPHLTTLSVSIIDDALRSRPESRGFNSRWCQWNFSFTQSFWLHYGPGVDSASNRNGCVEYFLAGKGGRCVGLTLPLSSADCLEI